eukprot:GHVU01209519.1.p1 GENE.GHVU01209519.1~~GHVU01209519.1.p1  ORF type:complete len:136 (+),score=16.65 GHVU01209519.1:1213-1620(+)
MACMAGGSLRICGRSACVYMCVCVFATCAPICSSRRCSISSNVESMISKLLDEKLQPIHTKLDQLCELSGKIDQLKADVKEATNILVMEVIRRCHEVQTATEGGYEDLVGTIAHLSEDVKTMAEAVERRTRFNLE